jgi:hypothetical protein
MFELMLLNHRRGHKSSLFDWIPFIGILNDLKMRILLYPSDFYHGVRPKSLFSIAFMFFCSIAPALAFGVQLEQKIGGNIGLTEVLSSTALCGMIFAVIGGQPLVIVGVTGPVVIFTTTVYNLAEKFKIPFLEWYCVIGFIAGFFHILLAIFNVSLLVKYVTRFSEETFGLLIAIIFIVDGVTQFSDNFINFPLEVALFCFIIALGSFYLAYSLHYAKSWIYFPRLVCKILADTALPISIAAFTGLVYLPKLRTINIPYIQIPLNFRPTLDRPWFVTHYTLPVWAYFAAIPPALLITALFYFDHNVSSLLSQKKEFNLKKASAFHWDIFVVGINMIICAFFGLPYTSGLIPQSPLHVRSLSTVKKVNNKEVVSSVIENRLTGFLQSFLIGVLTMFGQKALNLIPLAITTGLFLFMGMTGFDGNQFADRIKLWFISPACYHDYQHIFLKRMPIFHIIIFTLIQLMCWGIIYFITWTQAAIAFPLLILFLVPLRKWLLPMFFTKEQLFYLDNHEVDNLKFVTSEKSLTRTRLVDYIYKRGYNTIKRTRLGIFSLFQSKRRQLTPFYG